MAMAHIYESGSFEIAGTTLAISLIIRLPMYNYYLFGPYAFVCAGSVYRFFFFLFCGQKRRLMMIE